MSCDSDSFVFSMGVAVIRGPIEGSPPALCGEREEGDERVRGTRGEQIRAEHFHAVIRAGEPADDFARDHFADLVATIASFHRMRDQGLDLDYFTALGLRRHIDEGVGHFCGFSRQAARVTTTSTLSDQKESSLSCAIAMTFCESTSRIRVEPCALPARGSR